jgi:hypothetical protein
MTRGAPRCGKCRDDRNEEAMRSAKVHTAGRRVATWLTVADFDRLKGKADAAKVPIYLFIQQVLADAP